jgi:F-type H+-transporting ATPase subunit delta
VRQLIRGYTDGVIEQARLDQLAVAASELAAVRDLVASSDDLKTVLSDPGIPRNARRGVIDDLLANRVSRLAVRLLDFIVMEDRATEFLDNLNWLAERVQAAAHRQHPESDVILGRKGAEERVDGFATAMLDHGDSEGVDEPLLARIEDELFAFLQTVGANEQLRAALTSRDVPAPARRAVVMDLLGEKAHPISARLAAYATQIGRPRDYEALLEFLVERAARATRRRLAEVRSAVAMDDAQRQNLAEALERVVGHNVDVRVTVDPSLLAGFAATIGDTVVDGSARHRLELLKERLVMPEVNVTTGERN